MNKKIWKNIFILSGVSFIFSSLFFILGFWNVFEFKVYDLLIRNFSSTDKNDNICLVYIDQLSIDALSRQGINWPWPRQIYAPVIEYLSESEAIFIDIIFSEYSSYGVEDDKILARAIKNSGNIYLPLVLSKEKRIFDEEYLKEIVYQNQLYLKDEYNSVIFPLEEFKNVAKGLGNVSIVPDEDGIYRKIPLFFKIKEYLVPNFVLSYFISKNALQIESGYVKINGKKFSLIDGKLLLKYSKEKNPFQIFSFVELLELSTLREGSPKIKREFFKGKTVLIGLTAAGLFDLKPTPISSKTPGVFIHAVTFENLLNQNFIVKAPDFLILSIIFFISLVIPYTFLKHYSIKINLFFFLLVALILLCIGIISFKLSLYIQFLPSFMCLIFSSVITLLYSYAIEGKERRFIKRTFSQYMDKKIVDYLLNNPSSITPGGQKKKVTVFFADIQGFTTISEKLSAEETAMMLHKVLNSLTEVVIKHGGVVDKYIGDSIMAFWGAPIKSDFDETNACKAAVECIDRIEDLNIQFSEKGLPTIKIRIGIHSGDAIVGNIGSDRLFNYTVIGDTVNIASRLESVNKFFKTNIIISEETHMKISADDFISRELGVITVKGRENPIKIFEIADRGKNERPEKLLIIEKYNQAYSFFEEKKWHEAKEILKFLLKDYPDDFPSKFYLNFIEEKYSVLDNLTEEEFIVKIKEK